MRYRVISFSKEIGFAAPRKVLTLTKGSERIQLRLERASSYCVETLRYQISRTGTRICVLRVILIMLRVKSPLYRNRI